MYCEVLAEHVNCCVADVAVKDWTSRWSTECESALDTAVCSQCPTVDTTSGSCHFTVKWSWWNSDRSQCCHQCLQCQQGVFLPVCSSALSGLKLVNDHYSATVGERSIVISLSVCLSVCLLSVLMHISGTVGLIPCADPLWPWLGPPLVVVQYVKYFQFYGWCHIWP